MRAFEFSAPVETSHHQAPSALDTSQQGGPATTESLGLANIDPEHSFPDPDSHRPRYGKQICRPAMERIARAGVITHEEGQIQPIASLSLGHIHTSKVSKVPTKKKSGRRRQQQHSDASAIEISNNSTVPARPNFAEPISSTTAAHPRRSSRQKKITKAHRGRDV